MLDYFPYGSIRIDDKAGTYSDQRKYIGQEYDANTGLNYLNARYYDSGIGRFVSEDPVFWEFDQGWLADPHNQNSYAYARDNPIINADPTGQLSLSYAYNYTKGWATGTFLSLNSNASNFVKSLNPFHAETAFAPENETQTLKATTISAASNSAPGRTAGLVEGSDFGENFSQLVGILSMFVVPEGEIAAINDTKASLSAENSLSRAASHSLKENHYPGFSKSEIESIAKSVRENPDIKINIAGPDAKQYYYDTKGNNLFINNPKNPTIFQPKKGADYLRSAIKSDIIKGNSLK